VYKIIGFIKLQSLTNSSVSPSAKIYCPQKIKQVVKGAVITIGRNCVINALSTQGIVCYGNSDFGEHTYVTCSSGLKNLGVGLKIGNRTSLGTHGLYGCAGGIEIGNNVMIGNYVSMHSENHNISRTDIPMTDQGVSHLGIKIGNDCWIGAKVTILDGVTVGDGCVLAAGSVLTKGNYPPYSIIAGVPAKVIKNRKI
jgi:acetyltransferase-like isoleucine patch superfamily enzyme